MLYLHQRRKNFILIEKRVIEVAERPREKISRGLPLQLMRFIRASAYFPHSFKFHTVEMELSFVTQSQSIAHTTAHSQQNNQLDCALCRSMK